MEPLSYDGYECGSSLRVLEAKMPSQYLHSGEPLPLAPSLTGEYEEDVTELRKRIKEFCRGKLEEYKIPIKVETVSTPLFGAYFKRIRR